ncbi:ABC transporter substrate-binding protein [Desulfovibrio subterraneus]|nr:ABC transporter substrate-binding protein [Desulfovibrio subterraneus]
MPPYHRNRPAFRASGNAPVLTGRLLHTLLAVAVVMIFFVAETQAAEPKPIVIAACFAMTGSGALENSPNFRVAQLAAKDINDSGGVLGRPLQILELDTGSTPIGARQAALAALDAGVVAVVGPSWSSQGFPMARVLQKAGIPMIGPTTTAVGLTAIGNYIFRACYTDTGQAEALAGFARQEMKANRVAVMTIAGDVYSEGLSSAFAKRFTETGGTVAVQSRYLEDAMDFTRQVDDIVASRPDIVFASGFTRDSGLLLKQARKAGVAIPFIGGDGWSPSERFHHIDLSEGENYYSSHWHKDMDTPANRHFIKLLQQEMGDTAPEFIDAATPTVFDAVGLIAEAIRRAQDTDPEKIRIALNSISNYEGVTGTISYAGSRDPAKPVIILHITPDGVAFVKAVTP